MKDKIVVPYAPILVESTRSVGYSFEAAVADIIDNSISAGAREVNITFDSTTSPFFCIADDGCGMTADELENAMRYGSQSSLETRGKNDMGRFGLGMKMASMSQCRKMTVITKKSGIISAASWDLDHIIQKNNWALKRFSEKEIKGMPGYDYLKDHDTGTVVVWQEFDYLRTECSDSRRDFGTAFLEKVKAAREHVALVFHRFIRGNEPGIKKIKIFFNNDEVEGIDPFLENHPATQRLADYPIPVGNEQILVKPFILPIISKLRKKDIDALGGKESIRQRQGFYVYRNKRLIIWGTWFRIISQSEVGKLARIRVDIPNTLDTLWGIDVKKSKANIPHMIRDKLRNVIEDAMGKSEKVIKYRGRNPKKDDGLIHTWDVFDDRGKIRYQINRNMPSLKALMNHLGEDEADALENMLKMVEEEFPYYDVYYRMAKEKMIDDKDKDNEKELYNRALSMVHDMESCGEDIPTFIEAMRHMERFAKHPEVINKIAEVYGDD